MISIFPEEVGTEVCGASSLRKIVSGSLQVTSYFATRLIFVMLIRSQILT